MNLRYTECALSDIDLAIGWYERQSQGLGRIFLASLEQAVRKIIAHPQSYQLRYSKIRGCAIRRFPFMILYTIETDRIVIHSVFACRRSPGRRP